MGNPSKSCFHAVSGVAFRPESLRGSGVSCEGAGRIRKEGLGLSSAAARGADRDLVEAMGLDFLLGADGAIRRLRVRFLEWPWRSWLGVPWIFSGMFPRPWSPFHVSRDCGFEPMISLRAPVIG